jgi:hypothetical protein
VKSTNLRNKPVDKRRLSAEDKQQYQSGQRRQALARARQRRGQMAWNNKVKVGKQEHKPGSGGFQAGREVQQQRVREKGQKLARSKKLRSS